MPRNVDQRELEAPPIIETEFSNNWRSWLNRVYEKLRGPLWEDLLIPLSNAGSPGTAPTLAAFGPSSTTYQYAFNRGDSVQASFHIPHNIKPESKMYPHVHWSTDGTAGTIGVSDIVEWRLTFDIAKGHQQESFTTQSTITMNQSVFNSVVTSGPTAWHHYITEASDAQAITAPEVDSLILMKIERLSGGADTYTNAGNGHVFGLFVDFHFQKDRLGTPQKNPYDSNSVLKGFYEYGKR